MLNVRAQRLRMVRRILHAVRTARTSHSWNSDDMDPTVLCCSKVLAERSRDGYQWRDN
jgi:hypothetical protein